MSAPVVREPIEQIAPRVLAALRRGRDHLKSAETLQDEARVECERRTSFPVRKAIRFLILGGHPIVSNDSGFWLAEHSDEIAKYVGSLDRRNAAVQERIDALKATAVRMRASEAS